MRSTHSKRQIQILGALPLTLLLMALVQTTETTQAAPVRSVVQRQPSLATESTVRDNLALTIFYLQMQLEQEVLLRLVPPSATGSQSMPHPDFPRPFQPEVGF